jgi:L-ascorbate metabolism protein UlaG (beta-lactamase superfamily)
LVEIKWFGHSCFELKSRNLTLITDPFKGIGIPEPIATADIVLCSHSHQDHNNAKPVLSKDGQLLEGSAGSKQIKGITIKGVESFHDDMDGSKRGKNTIYTFKLDDISFCHLGDLGHKLSPSTIKQIGTVDVLFIPVGGYFTIGPETATEVCKQLNPRIIIPMHYRMPELSPTFNLLKTVDDFLDEKENIEKKNKDKLSLEESDLPKEQRIVILSLK